MKFDEFLNQGWQDHQDRPQEVAERLLQGIGLLESENQIPPLASLAAHVWGEHLGSWTEGIRFLSRLRESSLFQADGESGGTVRRLTVALELASGQSENSADLGPSDRIRALAVAASALAGQRNVTRARRFFAEARELADAGLEPSDPAHRALAVTANNLACALEDQASRSEHETQFMLEAARAARRHWEIAGTWLETERAEYRLSQSLRKAGKIPEARAHAILCLEIIERNGSPGLEMFYGLEALILAETEGGRREDAESALARAESEFQKLPASDREWCAPVLESLRAALRS